MSKVIVLALATAASALASAAHAVAQSMGEGVEAPSNKVSEDTAAEDTAPKGRGRGRPAAEKPVEETAKEEPKAPEGKTYDQLKELIAPLVKDGKGEDVKKVIAKYSPNGLKELEAKHHAAFEKDIEALSF